MDLKKVLESDCDLYSIALDDFCTFEFRLLKIKEFNLFSKLTKSNISPLVLWDEIFSICFLGNPNHLPKTLPAGYTITTGHMIYKMSGDNEGEDFLLSIAKERKLNPINSIYEHMRCTIFSAFASLTPACIEQMTEKQFIKNFVAAENLLSKTKPGFQRLDLENIYKEMYGIQDAETPETEHHHHHQHSAATLEQELGHREVQEAEDQFLKEELARINQGKLNRSHLQSLDRR